MPRLVRMLAIRVGPRSNGSQMDLDHSNEVSFGETNSTHSHDEEFGCCREVKEAIANTKRSKDGS